MMTRRMNGFLVVSLLAALFLYACSGGGGGSTAPPPPTATTGNATGITNVGATLNGTVNPNGLASETWFEWGTDSTLATFDNTAKQPLAAGTTPQARSAPISGLAFGTTYFFRMVASNSSGVSKGSIGNFSTSALRPTVTTSSAINLTATSATLQGEANPNLLDSVAWFEYGTDNTLAGFNKTSDIPIGSGSAVVPVSENISSLNPGETVYFRVAASNAAGEQKGNILSFDTSNPPPVANAGLDNTVEMGQAGALDGSGSTTPFGTITDYLWQQVAGQAVVLDNNAAVSTAFTAPDNVAQTGEVLRFQLTVTDSRGLTASDNVDITVRWVGFRDSFDTDTITGGTYNPIQLQTFPTGTLTYDAAGQRALVTTGDEVGLQFSNPVPASTSGEFSVDFMPIITYPSHGGVWVRLDEDVDNYYVIANFDWSEHGSSPFPNDNVGSVRKIVGGVIVDEATFSVDPTDLLNQAYTQGQTYNIKVIFSPTQVILEGFGAPVTLNTTDNTALSVNLFKIETGQQDAYYDNIKLLSHP